MICKAEGVILKTQKLGETSKILTLFTREVGKLKLVAKGARSSRSRYTGTLEPLNHLAVVYYAKENRELHTLSQADLVQAFPGIRKSLEKWTIASACCELLYRLEFPPETVPLVFRYLTASLDALESAQYRVRNVLRHFELLVLKYSGFAPNFASCLLCGGKPTGEKVAFEIARGGFIGSECGVESPSSFQLSLTALRALQVLAELPTDAVTGTRFGKTVAGEIDSFLKAYLTYHFEGMADLRSLKFLYELETKLKQA